MSGLIGDSNDSNLQLKDFNLGIKFVSCGFDYDARSTVDFSCSGL